MSQKIREEIAKQVAKQVEAFKRQVKQDIRSMRVTRHENTIFVSLPETLWRNCKPFPLATSGSVSCACGTCKGGTSLPVWDTVALTIPKSKNHAGFSHAWTVHYPTISQNSAIMNRQVSTAARKAS